MVTRDAWIKRAGRLTSEKTRVREGDEVYAVVPGSTVENVVLFTSEAVAYTMPIVQVPSSKTATRRRRWSSTSRWVTERPSSGP